MNIVIDANTLSLVFDPNNQNHTEFKPIFDYIDSGLGTMAYGGSKYEEELKRMTRILRLIVELQKRGSVICLERDDVDSMSEIVADAANNPRFNDPHIIAIVIVGKCRLVCSIDKDLHVFIQERSLYPKHFRVPKIYTGLSSVSILNRR